MKGRICPGPHHPHYEPAGRSWGYSRLCPSAVRTSTSDAVKPGLPTKSRARHGHTMRASGGAALYVRQPNSATSRAWCSHRSIGSS